MVAAFGKSVDGAENNSVGARAEKNPLNESEIVNECGFVYQERQKIGRESMCVCERKREREREG